MHLRPVLMPHTELGPDVLLVDVLAQGALYDLSGLQSAQRQDEAAGKLTDIALFNVGL